MVEQERPVHVHRRERSLPEFPPHVQRPRANSTPGAHSGLEHHGASAPPVRGPSPASSPVVDSLSSYSTPSSTATPPRKHSRVEEVPLMARRPWRCLG